MNNVRITIVIPEAEDDEAMELKKALEKLLEPKAGATITMNLRPAVTPFR